MTTIQCSTLITTHITESLPHITTLITTHLTKYTGVVAELHHYSVGQFTFRPGSGAKGMCGSYRGGGGEEEGEIY